MRYAFQLPATLFLAPACMPLFAASFTFVAIGDTPYQVPAHYRFLDRLVGRINAVHPAFTIHVGDVKNGGSRCDDARLQRVRDIFDRFEQPLVYTPGDNEWTDCHRPDNGGFDPVERLAKVRQLFFPNPAMSLGRSPMALESQSADPAFRRYVENARWQRDGVWFATLDLIGSNNNLQRDREAVNEYIDRNAANLAWIDETFARAIQSGGKAVVIAFQADPGWEFDGHEDRRSGFSDTVRTLKANAIRFGKPVLIIHGDHHRLLIDKPLYQDRKLVYNATRLMVFGDAEVQGVMVSVDPDDFDVFGFRTLTVPENVVPAGKAAR